MKQAIAMAFIAMTAFAAVAQDTKPACASPKEPPKQLTTKDLEPGSGRDIKFRSAILVSYTGWLYDGCAPDMKGAEFDSSKGRATPFGFVVGAGKVIKGWDEGVIGMKEKGSKRLLVIPPDKGYGERGAAGGKIPANATLVFEVETISIVHQPGEEAAKK